MNAMQRTATAIALVLCALTVPAEVLAEPPSVKLQTAALVAPATAWNTFTSATTHTPGLAATSTPAEIVELANALGQGGTCTGTCFAALAYQYVRNNIAVEFRFGLGKGGRGALIDQSGTPFDQAQLFIALLRQAGITTASYQVGTVTLSGAQFQAWTGLTLAQVACQFLGDGGIPATVNGFTSCSSIPAGSSVSTIVMGHVWVNALTVLYDPSYKIQVVKQGLTSSQLGTALGCTTSCASSATGYVPSPSASGIPGVNQISGVNQTGLETQLTTYAKNLQTYIQAQNATNRQTANPNMQMEDLVGGLLIDVGQPVSGGSELPSTSYIPAGSAWTTEIPDQYRTRVTVKFGPTASLAINATIYVDEIAGYRLRLYNAALNPTTTTTTVQTGLYSEQMLLAGGSIQNQGFGLVPLTLIIQHPYANPSGGTYLSETLNFNTKPVVNWCQRPPVPGGCATDSWQVETITILVGLGDATESTVAHYSALSARDVTHTAQETLSPNNSSLTSAQQVYPCTTAAALGTGPHGDFGCYQILQGAFAAGWLTQASRAAHLAAAINSSALQLHHSVGIITSGPAIPGLLLFNVQSSVSINSASATASDRHAAFFTTAAVLDRLEGSIAEQQGSEWEGGSAISMLTRTNYVGNSPFYDLTSANISAALNSGQLSSWVNGGFTPTLTSYTSANFELIVPQQATVGPFCFSNACAIFYFAGIAAFGPNNDRIAYATNGVGWDKGAAGVDDPTTLVTQQTIVQSSNAKRAANLLAVSENTGAFTLSPAPDLVTGVGPFPYSLAYKRYYSSSQDGISGATDIIGFLAGFGVRTATELSMLPIGWTHSLAISARLTNDGMATLGRSSALDASQAITALYVLRQLNLTSAPNSFQSNVASIFTANWLGEGLIANVVTVRRPPKSESFVRLPDGSYDSPPGDPARLVQQCPAPNCNADGTRAWNNNTADYNAWDNSGFTFLLTDSDGSVLTFGYGIYPNAPFGNSSGGAPNSGTLFVPSTWVFPQGVTVTFTFTPLAGVGSLEGASCLIKVQNSLGRSLSFTDFCGSGGVNPPSSWTVTDDSSRTVTLTVQPTQNISHSGAISPYGFNPGDLVAITDLLVTGPDGTAVSQYDYVAPPSTNIARSYYRLADWRTPGDRTKAFMTVGFDSLYRANTLTDNTSSSCCTTHYFLTGVYGTENQKLANIVDPLGALTTQYLDRWGSVLQSIDPLHRVTSYSYDTARRLIQLTFPELNGFTYTYDVRSNLLSTTRHPVPGSALALSGTTTATSTTYEEGATVWPCVSRNTCNKPYQKFDAKNNATTYHWNTDGTLSNVTYPNVVDAGTTVGTPYTSYGYTSYGLVQLKTQRVWQSPSIVNLVTQYNYNTSNKYTLSSAVVDYGGQNLTTSYVFDYGGTGPGNVTSIKDPDLNVTGYKYDSLRRLTEIDAPLGVTTLYTYDLDSQLTSTRRADSSRGSGVYQTEVKHYWPTGDLAYVAHPDANPTAPAAGASTTVTSLPCPSNYVTCYTYDADGRVLAASEPLTATTNRVTADAYDLAGQRLCTWRGFATTASALTQVRGSTPCSWSPGSYSPTAALRYDLLAYSQNGTLTQTTDSDGNLTTMVYDGFDRLSQMILPGTTAGTAAPCHATFTAGDNCEQYGYDNNDNRFTKTNRSGQALSYSFDAMNQEYQRVVPANPNGHFSRTLTETYDLLGRRWQATADSQTLTFTFDTAGRPQSVADSILGSVRYQYDAASNRIQVTWPDGYYVTYVYDALNRVCKVKENATTTCAAIDPISSLVAQYTWDTLSRRQSIAYGNGVNSGWSYFYDSALSGITHTMGSRSVALAYARNQVNQLTTQTVSITDPTATLTPNSFLLHPSATSSTAYAPNNLNQYNTVAGISKGYDLNGNLTSDGTYAYEYDEENRLRSATGAGNSIAYDYDPLERRRAKTVNGTMTRFLSDDQEEIGEYTSTPSLLRRYINGHSIDEHLVQVEAAGTHYYFQVNHQGTTLLTSDTSATPVLTSFRYGAYGDSDSPATGAAFRYTGRRLDPETGLYYYRARYYSSTLGRFLQTDPIGSADDLNLYAYTGNDPVDATDPDGREIRLQSHPVGLGNNHSKITIIPKNQSRYRHDARFKNKLPDGRVYATIGAGPERPIPGAMGHLIAGVDRERDVKQDKLQSNEKLTLPNGMSEDAAIDALFSDEAAYRNDLDYALFPDKGKDEYNSNGFANSLLKAAGFGGYKQPPSTPGWRVLLPPGEFRKPVITVIECPNGVCAK